VLLKLTGGAGKTRGKREKSHLAEFSGKGDREHNRRKKKKMMGENGEKGQTACIRSKERRCTPQTVGNRQWQRGLRGKRGHKRKKGVQNKTIWKLITKLMAEGVLTKENRVKTANSKEIQRIG